MRTLPTQLSEGGLHNHKSVQSDSLTRWKRKKYRESRFTDDSHPFFDLFTGFYQIERSNKKGYELSVEACSHENSWVPS